MGFWARIAVFVAVETVLLITPMMFPAIPTSVGYIIYGFAIALFLLGGGYILFEQISGQEDSRGPYRRGYVKQGHRTLITKEALRRFSAVNSYVLWADNQIAQRYGLDREFSPYDPEILMHVLSSIGIATFEMLEKEMKSHKAHVAELSGTGKIDNIDPGYSIMLLFYWLGAERGAEFLRKTCESTGRITGGPGYYNDLVFTRDQIKPIKDRTKLPVERP